MGREEFKADANNLMIKKAASAAGITLRKGEIENQRGKLIDRIFNVQEAAHKKELEISQKKIDVTKETIKEAIGKFDEPDKGRSLNIEEKRYEDFKTSKDKIKEGKFEKREDRSVDFNEWDWNKEERSFHAYF